MPTNRLGAAALFAVACLALAGCTDSPVESAPPETQSTVPIPSPSSTAATTTSDHPVDLGVVPAGCEGLGASGLTPVSNDVDDRVFGYVVTETRDAGPTKHASGEAILDDAGVPVAYKVADGDTASAISDRFCIGYVDYLGWINSVRRNGVEDLYAGDTLNLDRFKITSIGDENGVVYENEVKVHIPPQKG